VLKVDCSEVYSILTQ